MTIWVDSREKERAIKGILETFKENGVKWFPSMLFVGDYMSLDNAHLCIERKQNLSELCTNVCQGHERFVNELTRAQDYDIKLIVLVEHGRDVKSLDDVIKWENPRLKQSPMAVSGERLYKILSSMSKKYGVDFQFCTKAQTGNRILELLK